MQKRQKIWLWTWKLSWPQAIDTINSALKLGYHTIDTAWIYQNAPEIASAIKESWVSRSELFITSKTRFDYIPNYQKHQFQRSDFSYSLRKQRFEKHLQELETDYLDELLMHRPTREENDLAIFEYQIFRSLTSNNFTQSTRSLSLAIKSSSTLVFLIQRWSIIQKPTIFKSLPIHRLLTDISSKILLSSTLQKNIKQPQLKSVLLDV